MTSNEYSTIKDLINELWPNWSASEAERRIWRRKLIGKDFEICKKAIEETYSQQGEKDYKPILSAVLTKVYARTLGYSMINPHLAYSILCIEHNKKEWVNEFEHNFYSRRMVGFDSITSEAEGNRQKVERIYGGRWIVKQPEEELSGYENMTWGRYYVTCTSGKKKGLKRRIALSRELFGNDDEELKEANSLVAFFKKQYGGAYRIDDKGIFASRIPQKDQPAIAVIGDDVFSKPNDGIPF